MTNRHVSEGNTTAVFISKEEREAGVDPQAVIAAKAREASQNAQHHHGVQVQMVNPGRAPVPAPVAPNVIATRPREVAPVVLTGFDALRFVFAHPGTPLTHRDPSSGLLSYVEPATAFAAGLPTEQELEAYHVQVDALGRPMLPPLAKPRDESAPALTGAPPSSAPSGAGGLELMGEVQTLIPEAHSQTAFQRVNGPALNVQHVQPPVRVQVVPTARMFAGPHVRVQLYVAAHVQEDGSVTVAVAADDEPAK